MHDDDAKLVQLSIMAEIPELEIFIREGEDQINSGIREEG